MSVLLEAVHEARELRDLATREFRRALVKAHDQHSLREIARAAGVSHNAIVYWLRKEKGDTEK